MPRVFLSCGFGPAGHLLELARAAEECGYAGIALPDHIANPVEVHEAYPATPDGSVPWDLAETPWLDPFVGLTAVAARTATLDLITRVYVLPTRHPVVVAKLAASLATLFPGRFLFGVGTGWLKDDFVWSDTSYADRGARTEDAIGLLRAFWGTQPATYEGPFFSLPPALTQPVPPVPPPILLGGSGDRARARAARLGDGFLAMPATMDDFVHRELPRLVSALTTHGRTLEDFHINATITDLASPNTCAQLDELGVDSVNVDAFDRNDALNLPLPEKLRAVREYAAGLAL